MKASAAPCLWLETVVRICRANDAHAIVVPILVAGLLGFAGPARALEPVRPAQQSFIRRAAFADGRLWTLADSGVLSEIAPDGDARREAATPDPVLDICVARGELRILTAPRTGTQGRTWTLRRHAGGDWPAETTIERQDDWLHAMACADGDALLLTSKRLIEIAGGRMRVVPIDGAIKPRPVAATAVTPQAFYVGTSMGEWGGDLTRIDRRNGRATLLLEGNVNALAPEPWRPDCVAVALGLVHFAASGRIAEVCPERAGAPADRTLLERPLGPKRQGSQVAYFALAPAGGALVAAGLDGLTTISGDGAATPRPLPPRRDYDGVKASFTLPHLVVVLTEIASRTSVSGPAPLLVPRP